MTSQFIHASAHGRFQPLHNEHMKYLLAAKERCDVLWVGITMPDGAIHSRPLGRERERPTANPLTFYERSEIIRTAMIDSGVSPQGIRCIPFPIEEPERLSSYLPLTIPCLTTINDSWNEEKIRLLETIGYQVIVLYKQEKSIFGYDIRRRILDGDNDWKKLVPAATQQAVERLDVRARLLSLAQGAQ